jgi:outer membrane biogenesis lipoprotein LolB
VQQLTLDEAQQLPQQLRQQDWTVQYEDFGEFEGLRLPTRLRVHRGDTSARIILRSWQVLSH